MDGKVSHMIVSQRFNWRMALNDDDGDIARVTKTSAATQRMRK